MMRMRIYSSLVGCLIITGCTTNGMGYNDPSRQLVLASLEEVASMSRQTRLFIEGGRSEDDAVTEGKRMVASRLKDPEAARFQNVRIVPYLEGKIICGEVNGKNSYGAYVGYSNFAASPMMVTLESKNGRYASIDELANTGLRNACR